MPQPPQFAESTFVSTQTGLPQSVHGPVFEQVVAATASTNRATLTLPLYGLSTFMSSMAPLVDATKCLPSAVSWAC
jgi:hypothetical protein